MRSADALTEHVVRAGRRVRTGPFPRVPLSAFQRVKTLETGTLPGLFASAFALLVLVQLFLRW